MFVSDQFPPEGGFQAASLPLRHVWITGGFVTLLGTMIWTTSDRLVDISRHKSDVNRQEIIGTVEYDGRPLARGTIHFLCQLVEAEMDFHDAEAPVRNGVFRIPKHQGPMPGCYLVSVKAGFGPVPDRSIVPPVAIYDDQSSSVIRASLDTQVLVRVESKRVNRFNLRLY